MHAPMWCNKKHRALPEESSDKEMKVGSFDGNGTAWFPHSTDKSPPSSNVRSCQAARQTCGLIRSAHP